MENIDKNNPDYITALMESIELNIKAIRELTRDLVTKLTEYAEVTGKRHKEHMSKLREMIDPAYRKSQQAEREYYRSKRNGDESHPF